MARSEARLQFGIWRGLGDDATTAAKLLYAVVLTEPTLNYAGVCALRERRWAKEASLTLDELAKAMHELRDSRHLVVDDDTEEVLVRTFIRNDGVADQPNLLKAALRETTKVVSTVVRRALAAELRRLPPKPDDTAKMRYPDPHAAADELDPIGPPTTPPDGPGESHSDAIPEPIENPSETHPQTSPERKTSRTHPGTPGGRGGGRGRGETPVTENSTSAASQRSARASRERTPAAELATTAHTPTAYGLVTAWAANNPGVASGHRRQLGKAVDQLLAQGADPALVPAALDAAHEGRFHSPVKALPLAYEDIRRAAANAGRPAQGPQRVPTTTQRVQGALALLRPDGDQP